MLDLPDTVWWLGVIFASVNIVELDGRYEDAFIVENENTTVGVFPLEPHILFGPPSLGSVFPNVIHLVPRVGLEPTRLSPAPFEDAVILELERTIAFREFVVVGAYLSDIL